MSNYTIKIKIIIQAFFHFLSNIFFKENSLHSLLYNKDAYFLLDSLPKASFLETDRLALFSHHYPVTKKAIWHIKYKNDTFVTKIFSESLAITIKEFIFENFYLADFEIILIPTPLHKSSLKERGYNQSERICEYVLNFLEKEKLNLKIKTAKDLILKNKKTKNQNKTKTKFNRLNNLKDAFTINPKYLENKNNSEKFLSKKVVFLVDDVTTTGATFSEIKNTLKPLSPSYIYSFAISH